MRSKTTHWLATTCLALLPFLAFAQPANDDCANALPLTVAPAGSCTGSNGTTVDLSTATDSPTGNPSCDNTGVNYDVWFTFTAPAGGSVLMSITGNTSVETAVFDNCAQTTEFFCSSSNSNGQVISGLTPGVQYVLNVWRDSQSGVFDLCLSVPPPPPANDECANATPVTLGTTSCGPTVTATNQSATGVAGSACGSTSTLYGDGDIWFSFQATATTAILDLITGVGSLYISVYAECGGACVYDNNLLSTSTNEVISGLTAGETYFIQMYESGNNAFGTIEFCMSSPPPAPANDECAGSFSVTVDGAAVSGTVNGATPSAQADVCTGTFDDDVWFSFVANGSAVNLNTINQGGSTTDLAYEILSGSCGALTSLQCSDPQDFQIQGLTSGQTYYIRVASWTSTAGQTSTFDIQLTTPPPPPANDECSGATVVSVGNATCGPTVTATNVSATGTAGNVCGSTSTLYGDGDIWFSFEAGASTVFLDLITGVGSIYISVYDACGGACVYDNNFVSTSTDESITGLTPGETYFIRMYESGNNAFGTIEFCMYEVIGGPANDDCVDAEPVTVGSLSCGPTVSGSVVNATDSGEGPVCGSGTYAGGDVFYTFVAGGPVVELDLITTTGSLYGEVYSGSCGALTPVYCSNFLSTSSNELINGLTSGVTYTLRIFESGNDSPGNFSFCMFTPPPPPSNDLCSGAIAANVGANGTCPGGAGAYSEDFSQVTETGQHPSCDPSGNYDLWYTWTATAASINFTSGTGAPGFAVYGGTCSSLTEFGCLNNSSGTIGGLTVGEEYLLQVWDDTQGATTVTWCFEAGPACGDPTNLTVSNIAETTADVTFDPIAAGNTVEFGVTGFTPGTGTTVNVASGGSVTLTGLMASTMYDVYVMANCGGNQVGPVTFTTLGPPPSNDECSGAIPVAVQASATGCTPTVADNTNATNSTPIFGADPSCNSYLGGDLWYSFTATASTIDVNVSVNNFSTFSSAVYVAGCASTTEVDCDGTFGTGTYTLSGLTAGTEYLLRVYDWGNNDFGPSEFCLIAPPPPPANDECANAIALTDANGVPTAANGGTYTTDGATASNVTGACTTGTPDDDVWFSVEVPVAGSDITITVDGGSDFDAVLGVFTGSCAGLTQLACVDGTGTDGVEMFTFTSSITGGGNGQSSRQAPTVYLVQVYDFFDSGSFTISVTNSAPLPIELTSFTARPVGARNVVEWTVASEQDLYMYTVESASSADAFRAGEFATVADVAPRGTNGAIEAVYSAEDRSPARVTYYRLRAEDLDGSVEYSNVVAVTREGASVGGFVLAPNPVSDRVVVDFGGTASDTDRTVTVTDAAGRVVLSRIVAAGDARLEMPVGSLSSGLYTVTATDAAGSMSKRLIVE